MTRKILDPNIQLRKANSRYKLWISFKNKSSIALYGAETNATYNQMFFGKVTEVVLDRLLGFENCKLMAEKFYAGKFITAIIYDTIADKPVRKYVSDVVEDLESVNLSEHERYSRYTVKVTNNDVVLVPVPTEIDFKKEIENNLYKKQK
ncbi:MAG: hypothetical protein H7320_13790 [Ferruginibacter sp.]|nr:hypothetical protein [Ferruginibacter sp.]